MSLLCCPKQWSSALVVLLFYVSSCSYQTMDRCNLAITCCMMQCGLSKAVDEVYEGLIMAEASKGVLLLLLWKWLGRRCGELLASIVVLRGDSTGKRVCQLLL